MSATLIGVDKAFAALSALPRQARFAASQACNDTARDVQRETLKDLPDKFTLRSRGAPWWRPGTKMGFNIRFANKTNLQATIGSQADWLKLQEEGGTKRSDGHRVAVVISARPSPRAVLPRSIKPRRVLKRQGFILPTNKGDGIFIREDNQLRLLYMLKPQTKIKPVLAFVRTGTALADKRFGGHFARRFSVAMVGTMK